MKITINTATQQNITDILNLNHLMQVHLMLQSFKELHVEAAVKLSSHVSKAINALTIAEKAFILRFIGEYLSTKQDTVKLAVFKSMYEDYCARKYITNIDYAHVVANLCKCELIKVEQDVITLTTQKAQLPLLVKPLGYDLDVTYALQFVELYPPTKVETVCYIARIKGVIAGYLNGYISYFGNCFFAEIDEVSVNPEYKGQGAGTELIKHFEAACKEKKVTYISVKTPKNNAEAIKFYRKLGYCEDTNVVLEKDLY